MKTLIGMTAIGMLSGMSAFASLPEAVPGEYVIKLKDNYGVQSNSFLSEELNSYVKSTIPDLNVIVIKRTVMELTDNVVKTLSENPMVDIVEPNYIYRANKSVNDSMFAKQWGMKNTGQKDAADQSGLKGIDIGVERAWDVSTGSKKVVVAIIDSGIDLEHRDLKPNLWTNEAELHGRPGVDDDKNGLVDDIYGANFANPNSPSGNPQDDNGHGSHCAGIIGAKGNDGFGIAGINWNVRLMAIKFLDSDGLGSLEGSLKAINYATKMGAKVISNSWGGGNYSEIMKQAIQKTYEAGAVFVVAAGNEANDNDAKPAYPATYDVPNIISVGAIDNRGELAKFSNFGRSTVHVAAPGVKVFSTVKGGKYDSWSGTSMAAPHVSGVAALIAAKEPKLSGIEIKKRILATVKPLRNLRGRVRSEGVVNAYAALKNTVAPRDPNDPANWKSIPVNYTTPHPYTDNMKQTYEIRVPGAKQVSVYFDKFEVENNYDTVQVYDSRGKLVQKITGKADGTYTNPVDGSIVRIVITSDEHFTRYGFDITKAAWR